MITLNNKNININNNNNNNNNDNNDTIKNWFINTNLSAKTCAGIGIIKYIGNKSNLIPKNKFKYSLKKIFDKQNMLQNSASKSFSQIFCETWCENWLNDNTLNCLKC